MSGRLQPGILAQDPSFELSELGAGVDAQLIRQHLPAFAVGPERLRLAACSVEGDHDLAAKAFTERLLRDERLEFVDHVRMTAPREVDLQPVLQGPQA